MRVEDASGTLEYKYGRLGEVTKETRALATHLNGISDGEKVTYGYDAGGQVTSVTGSHWGHEFNYVTNILYDEYGQRTRIDYGNGTFTEYRYDPARRWLDTISTQNKWGQCYQNISYEFDAVGNVLGYENDCLDSASGNYRTRQTYGYDSLYQLIKVDGATTYNPYRSAVPEFISDYSQVFEFDADGLGNMTSKISTETVSPQKSIGDNLNYQFDYVYDENFAHRLIRAGERYYQYDANGNVTCEQDGSFEDNGEDVTYHKITKEAEDVYSTDYGWGLFREEDGEGGHGASAARYRRTYTWDEKNRLVSSVDANYSTAYIYGQDGQRSNKYTQSSETLYFNKMWTLHTDSGNNVYGGQTAKNIYLGETRIVTKLNSGSNPTYQEEYYKQYFYHSDHLGSASLISDYKGDEYQRIEYTPYGETWVEKTSNTGLEYLPYKFTAKELDKETGLYYYGARYLDPKYSRWISTDPALGEYVPGIGKGTAENFGSLPGMGGVFNTVNANLYHYAANNPVKYTDPDGREAGYVLDNEGAFGMGHAGMYVKQEDGKYAFFEVTGISKETNGIDPNANIGSVYMDKNKKETVVLSNSQNSFPNKKISQKFGFPCNSGALMRFFDTSKEMEAYLKIAGFDESIEFATTPQQDKLIYNAALSNGRSFHGYNLINNSCGIFARGALTTNDSGIKPFNAVSKTLENQGILQYMASNAIPKSIGADFMTANKYTLKRY